MSRWKVVAIKDMAAGNEVTGESWQETKIFDINDPISKIIDWAVPKGDDYSRKRITLTLPHGEDV